MEETLDADFLVWSNENLTCYVMRYKNRDIISQNRLLPIALLLLTFPKAFKSDIFLLNNNYLQPQLSFSSTRSRMLKYTHFGKTFITQ